MYYIFINNIATRQMPSREQAIQKGAEIVRKHPTQTAEISEDGKLPFFKIYSTSHGVVQKPIDPSLEADMLIADLKDKLTHCHPRETKRLERALKIAQDAEREQRRVYHDGILRFRGREKND